MLMHGYLIHVYLPSGWNYDPAYLIPCQVRDFSFYPDTGLVCKIMYDDFGLSFLPATFFDTFSMALSDVMSLGPSGIVVSDEAKYRERR